MRNSTSLCSSGHKKPEGLMSIFSIHSLVNFSEGMKSGGCFRRSGSERRGSDRMQQRIQYSSGRVVHTGCTWFAAFLYLAMAKASKGGPEGPGWGRGRPKPSDLFSSGDGFGRFDLIKVGLKDSKPGREVLLY